MKDKSTNLGGPAGGAIGAPALPAAIDRAGFEAELDRTNRPASTADDAVPPNRPSGLARRFPATDMPAWLMLGLVGLGLPRTVLADLDIVPPESGLLYYVLALTPFALWLVVAVVRSSRRPLLDFLVLGVLYGLSLVLIHQVFWAVGPSLGHHPPESAVDFADQVGPAWRELALRAYTSGIAMVIGIGSGLVAAAVAVGARAWRSSRARHAGGAHR
jgi:hypothetical protein